MKAQPALVIAVALMVPVVATATTETPFNYQLQTDNLDLQLWVKVYDGPGTDGNLVLDMRQSVPAEGEISGAVYHTGDNVEALRLDSFTGNIIEPLYAQSYIYGTYVEAMAQRLGVVVAPFQMAAGPGGNLTGIINAGLEPNSVVTVRIADLLSYNMPFYIYPDTRQGTFSGNVTMVGGQPVITGTSDNYKVAYLNNYIPGFNYTAEVGVDLAINVPEPATLSVLTLGGLAFLSRRR